MMTPRQQKMVDLFVLGYTWQNVADALGISRCACALKFRALFKKLGIAETGDGERDRAALAPHVSEQLRREIAKAGAP